MIGLCKLGLNIHERNLMKQTFNFIDEFIDSGKLKKYKESLNSMVRTEELGRVIIILNKTIETIKSRILARFYRNYAEGEFVWSVLAILQLH